MFAPRIWVFYVTDLTWGMSEHTQSQTYSHSHKIYIHSLNHYLQNIADCVLFVVMDFFFLSWLYSIHFGFMYFGYIKFNVSIYNKIYFSFQNIRRSSSNNYFYVRYVLWIFTYSLYLLTHIEVFDIQLNLLPPMRVYCVQYISYVYITTKILFI